MLIFAAMVVTAGTLLIQGLTLPWLVRALRMRGPDARSDALQAATVLTTAGNAGPGGAGGAGPARRRAERRAAGPGPDRRPFRRPVGEAGHRPRLHRDPGRAVPPAAAGRHAGRARRGAADPSSGTVDHDVIEQVLASFDIEESMLTIATERADRLSENQTVATPVDPSGSCVHLDAAPAEVDAEPLSEVCLDCVREGTRSVHLRRCAACGNVGCCDSSVGRHAERHFRDQPPPGDAQPRGRGVLALVLRGRAARLSAARRGSGVSGLPRSPPDRYNWVGAPARAARPHRRASDDLRPPRQRHPGPASAPDRLRPGGHQRDGHLAAAGGAARGPAAAPRRPHPRPGHRRPRRRAAAAEHRLPGQPAAGPPHRPRGRRAGPAHRGGRHALRPRRRRRPAGRAAARPGPGGRDRPGGAAAAGAPGGAAGPLRRRPRRPARRLAGAAGLPAQLPGRLGRGGERPARPRRDPAHGRWSGPEAGSGDRNPYWKVPSASGNPYWKVPGTSGQPYWKVPGGTPTPRAGWPSTPPPGTAAGPRWPGWVPSRC